MGEGSTDGINVTIVPTLDCCNRKGRKRSTKQCGTVRLAAGSI